MCNCCWLNLAHSSPALVGPPSGFTIASRSRAEPRQLRLACRDITVGPLIDPNYLGCDRDVDVLRPVWRSPARSAGAGIVRLAVAEVQPAPDVADTASVRGYLKRSSPVYFRDAGTCRVGTDEMAVGSTSISECAASSGFGSPTPRSCLPRCRRTPTRPCTPSPNAPANSSRADTKEAADGEKCARSVSFASAVSASSPPSKGYGAAHTSGVGGGRGCSDGLQAPMVQR